MDRKLMMTNVMLMTTMACYHDVQSGNELGQGMHSTVAEPVPNK